MFQPDFFADIMLHIAAPAASFTLTSPWAEIPPALLAPVAAIIQPYTAGNDRVFLHTPDEALDFARYDDRWCLVAHTCQRGIGWGASCMSRSAVIKLLRAIPGHPSLTIRHHHITNDPPVLVTTA